MLILDAFLTEEMHATADFKEYETVFMHGKKRKQIAGESSTTQKSLKITIKKQKVVDQEKDDDDSENRLESGSHKDNLETVDDDADNYVEKVEGGKRRDGYKYNHRPGALRRMCRRQGYMIQNMERKCVTTKQFWKTHKQVNQVLHQDRDAFCSAVPDLVSHEFHAQAPKIIEDLFKNYVQSNVIQVHPTITTSTETNSLADLQQQLYLKMKRSLQYQANDPVLREDDAPPEGEKRVKRHKESKRSKSTRGSSSKHSAKDSTTYVSKQQQQEWDAWVEETVIDEDEVIKEDETPELIKELQNVDKRVQTIYDYERMKATLNDALSIQCKNAEEYAYHLE
ncbi:hypothetical protein Tco_0580225, partial [Tanacetum coccineum]